jgi:hypothetical protein
MSIFLQCAHEKQNLPLPAAHFSSRIDMKDLHVSISGRAP